MENTSIEQTFSNPQKSILRSKSQLNLFLAGVGSGKTHLGGLLSRRFIAEFPKVRGFIGANTYDQLNTSTLFRIKKYWESVGITEYSNNNPNGVYVSGKEPPKDWLQCERNFERFTNIISFKNGALIFTGSLDNAVAHSGKEFGWAILDETKDTRETDFKEYILTRCRQSGMYCNDTGIYDFGSPDEQWNPLYILTSPAKVQWITEMFELEKYKAEINIKIFSKIDFFEKTTTNKHVVICSTYHNVDNVGENYIKIVYETNTEERAKALIYGNPFFTLGGEYYSSFSNLEHISKCEYNPSQALHFGFDQNVIPYTPALIGQIELIDGIWEVNIIDEIALEHPRNTTEHLSRELYRRYSTHDTGVFIYGDATGQRRTGLTANVQNHYQVIQQVLRPLLCNTSMRVSKGNEPNIKRRQFMMAIMEGKLPIRLNVSPRCKHLIDDFTYVMEDIDGGKEKKKFTDANGKSYEKYGHCSDILEYFIIQAFRKIYDNFIKISRL